MRKSKTYNGAGIYGLYNLMDDAIYIGASQNIAARFTQHRWNFKNKSKVNPMYNEPIDNFVFLVLYKMSKKDFKQFGIMFEALFITKAKFDRMKLYNGNKVSDNATGYVLSAFGIWDRIKESIIEETGANPWQIRLMTDNTKKKILASYKGAC